MRRRRSSIIATNTTNTTNTTNNTSFSSSSAADAIVAATAGEDTWKTWAGRSHGTHHFEVWDLVRGAKRTVQQQFRAAKLPPAGTTCPVCYTTSSSSSSSSRSRSSRRRRRRGQSNTSEPECDEDQDGDDEEDGEDEDVVWYVTSSCVHTVCLDCFQGYAASQVQDPQHQGPLKCPVCPQTLRKQDAIVALGHSSLLIQQWDEKIRNQLLRALPSYRPCPKCSNSNSEAPTTASTSTSTSTAAIQGGGFVTPSCLAPHYQDRRDKASKILHGVWMVPLGLNVLYVTYVLYICHRHPSALPLVDVACALAPGYALMVKSLRWSQRWVALWARTAFSKPITVVCPCCQKSFVLPASDDDDDNNNNDTTTADAESRTWIGAHTRPCPSCSVPISKAGGCNHVQCAKCHASFCWACMRLRTQCRAYACRNGAPNGGNAIPGNGYDGGGDDGGGGGGDGVLPSRRRRRRGLGLLPPRPGPGDSVLSTLDWILDDRRPLPPPWYAYDYALIVLGLWGRHWWIVQQVMGGLLTLVATIFVTGIGTWVAMGVLGWMGWDYYWKQQRQRQQQQQRQRRRAHAGHLEDAHRLAGIATTADQEATTATATAAAAAAATSRSQTRPLRRRSSVAAAPPTASEFLLRVDDRNDRDRARNHQYDDDDDVRRRRPRRRQRQYHNSNNNNNLSTEDEDRLQEAIRRSLHDQ